MDISPQIWTSLLQTGLKEDGWPWDWTTSGTLQKVSPSQHPFKAQIIAKSHGIWAAESLVHALHNIRAETHCDIHAISKLSDGSAFQPQDVLVELSGTPQAILVLERPFLNLAAYVCGIATATHRLVEKVKKACPKKTPRVTLTRKTLPHYRDIAIHGVRVGGGFPHRVSLAGGVLIKENHIAAAGGIHKAIAGARAVAPHGLKIEVEVRSESELKEALAAQAEGVLLDNFTPEQVRSALKWLEKQPVRPFVEVSGGLNESTIASYALEGVDILSTGSITHSVQSVDLSLLMDLSGSL